MLVSAKLSKGCWGEAVNTTVYVNRYPLIALNFKVPEEVWSGMKPEYGHLKLFGCDAYAHVNQGKLEPRAKKCYVCWIS